jgi:aldehyde:ferredoxin oxidoreductase
MELVIKLYEDKPSKIGVKYIYEYKAVREYEDLIRKCRNELFILKLEPLKSGITISLTSEITGYTITYKNLEYKPEQVKRLQAFFTAQTLLQFVHVFSKENTLYIAKPFRKQDFISISKIELISTGNFADVM